MGGHCLPKDSWLLAYGVKDVFSPRLMTLARELNDFMPKHMMELIESAFEEGSVEVGKSKISILGVAYLGRFR